MTTTRDPGEVIALSAEWKAFGTTQPKESAPVTTTVEDLLKQIAAENTETFIPTRYPYTYACDFLRNNPHVIPAEVRTNPNVRHLVEQPLMSRSDASRVRSVWAGFEGRDDEDLACVLADAFLSVHRIVRPA